ncbi:MAG: chemotaxis protein [Bdellovibrionota bacterium]
MAIKSPSSIGGGDGYFELIEFSLVRHLADGREIKGTYGVNVVKVREVIHMPKINPLASSVPGVEGIFELRGAPIPAVNLCTILGDHRLPVNPDDQIIVTEFAHKRAGFIVNQTNRIRRVPWEKILPPSADKASSMTGMMLIENNEFLFILDLERIIMQLESMASGRPSFVTESSPLPPMMGPKKAGYPSILLVDDSALILNSIARALNMEGYGVVLARNGLEGLQRLEEASTGHFQIDAIITDLEMPQMDGLSMLKRIKAVPGYNSIPVYLHTSLSDTGSRETAKSLGANEFFVKNDISTILKYLKMNLLGSKISA